MKIGKKLGFATLALAAIAGLCLFIGRGTESPRTETSSSLKPLATVSPNIVAAKASVSVPAVQASSTNQTPTVRGTLPYVVTSDRPIDKRLRLELESLGAKTVSVLSRHSLLVEATDAVRTRILSDKRFRKVDEFVAARKIQPELAKLVADGADPVEVSILALTAEDRSIVLECLENGGGELLFGCINEGDTIRAKVPASMVATLARRGDVRWMEQFVRPQLTNDQAVKPEAMNVIDVWNVHGLNGEGQKISTSDSGIDTGVIETMHLDLRNRVKGVYIVQRGTNVCDDCDSNGHGTHTAGSIVGDGSNCEGRYRGTAHGAELYAWFCGFGGGRSLYTPDTAAKLFRPEGVMAYIHSASWGSAVAGQYTSDCREYDNYVWDNPEFLPVFSAGNEGEDGSCSIGSPGSAKNVLTVGATGNLPRDPTETASFSSRGPCYDGRIKPDIAAPGHAVTSTRSCMDGGCVTNGYTSMSGTSMSCPLTAGSVALVRQWLMRDKGFEDVDGKRPTAALIKAVITGGAKGTVRPNVNQGWGRVDLEETLFPSGGRDIKLVDRLEFAQDEVFEFLIETTNAAPLEVQLCWVDYPGSLETSQSEAKLVNDLDLTVEVLGSADPVRYGNGGEAADTYNNMESVRYESAEPNKYLITVTCSHIVHDYTEGGAAALYIRGAFDPEYEPSGLERARIVRTPEVRYRSLDKALADAQNGDVIEVLDTIGMRKAVTLTNSVTIVATNVNPAASLVTAAGALTLEGDARVLFTNVVFGGTSPFLNVGNGCTAAFGGAVGLEQIVLATNGIIEIAGELDDKYAHFITAGKGHVLAGEKFGKASVDLATAQKFANLFVNAVDCELIGEAVDDGNSGVALQWVAGEVPEAATAARLTQDGKTVRFANLQVLSKYVTNDAAIAVTKDCYFDGILRTGEHSLTIGSTNGVVVTPKTSAGDEAFASFIVEENGSLSISNVVFRDFSQFGEGTAAFVVVNEGGSFLMQSGAELRNIINNGTYGAVYICGGTMSMTNDSRITDCEANGGYGGGVTMATSGSRLDFCGAEISGCSATGNGGGIYVSKGTSMTIAGAARIVGNVQRGEYDGTETDDDVYVADKEPTNSLTVSGVTSDARVGLRLTSSFAGTRDASVGKAFAALNGTVSEEVAESAFFNDTYHDYYDGLSGSVGDGALVWKGNSVAPGSVPESEGTVRVEIHGVTNFYVQLSTAFAAVTSGEVATVTLLTNVLMDADITVAGTVKLDGTNPNGIMSWRIYQGSVDENRDENMYFTIDGIDTSLCLTNVSVVGTDVTLNHHYSYGTLFKVLNGAALTMDDGAAIDYDYISDSSYYPSTYDIRSAPAIDLSAGACLTMKPGSIVQNCKNYADPTGDNEVVGAAVGATGNGTVVRMEGGMITSCNASHGGGLFTENGARVVVSGAPNIIGNVDYHGRPNNLYMSDSRCVILTNVFEGSIWCTRGAIKADSETNVFGVVSTNWTYGAEALTNSAAHFVNEVTGAKGCAVTNAVETILVWENAIMVDEESGIAYFEDNAGNRYGPVGVDTPAPPTPIPVSPTSIAFKSITRVSESEWELVVTNRVEGANYRLIWTQDLKSGFTTTGAWEQAAADGEWVTNVLFAAPVPSAVFWRAEGKDGEKQP